MPLSKQIGDNDSFIYKFNKVSVYQEKLIDISIFLVLFSKGEGVQETWTGVSTLIPPTLVATVTVGFEHKIPGIKV